MNKQLRIIAAILCMAPCMAYADIRTAQDKDHARAMELRSRLEQCLVYLNSGICTAHKASEMRQIIAASQKELDTLPELSRARKERCRVEAQLEFAQYQLTQLKSNVPENCKIKEYAQQIAALETELAAVKQKLVAENEPLIVIDGRKVVPIDLDEADIKRSEMQRLTEERDRLQRELKVAFEIGRTQDVEQPASECAKIEAKISGKPLIAPKPVRSTIQRGTLLEQYRILLTTEASRIQMLQNTALAHVTRQAITQDLMKVQRDIRALQAQLSPYEMYAVEKQVAMMQPANLPQQSKLETLLAQERNRKHQLETQLDKLNPEQIQALYTDLERIESEIKRERTQTVAPKVTDKGAGLEEQYQSALEVKRLSETLINTLMAKKVRNPREEDELAISLGNLDSANAAIQKLEADMAKSTKKPVGHSTQPRRQGAINPHGKALLSDGLTSLTEDLDFDPSASKTPAAPHSSPTDFDSEYVYVNGLGNAHLTTEGMSEGMDDLATALAISAKEAQAAQAEHNRANSTAAATSSAEADVKRHAVAPQSTTPIRPATRGKSVTKTSVDAEHDPVLKRALQDSLRSISTQPTEVQKKESGAVHSSSAAVAPKPQQTLRPIIETGDSELELALAMSLETVKAEALKRSEQPAQPQPVAAPVDLSGPVDLDDVGPMFGASNPRETSRPLNHLRRATFKGRKKLTAEQISTLADQLRLAHALKLSQ